MYVVYLCFSVVSVSSSLGNHLAERKRERERDRELALCSFFHVIVSVSSWFGLWSLYSKYTGL